MQDMGTALPAEAKALSRENSLPASTRPTWGLPSTEGSLQPQLGLQGPAPGQALAGSPLPQRARQGHPSRVQGLAMQHLEQHGDWQALQQQAQTDKA